MDHGKEQIGHGGLEIITKMSTRSHLPTSLTGKEYRQVLIVVTISIADTRAIENHAVIQQTTIAFRDGFHLLQDVGGLTDMKFIDLADLGLLHRIVLMMR